MRFVGVLRNKQLPLVFIGCPGGRNGGGADKVQA